MNSGLRHVLRRLLRRSTVRDSGADGLTPEVESLLGEGEPSLSLDLAKLAEDLGDLGNVEVPAAARERTWLRVQAEFRENSSTVFSEKKSVASRRTRAWILGPATVAVIGLVALVGVQAVGRDGSGNVVGEGGATGATALTSGSAGDAGVGGDTMSGAEPLQSTTSPELEREESSATGTTEPSSGTEETADISTASPPTTDGPTSTDSASTDTASTHSTSPSTTSSPAAEEATTTTSPGGGSVSTAPSTTAPTTTEPEELRASERREGSARSATTYLAQRVIAEDNEGAGALVEDEADSGLVQMIGSLDDPFGYKIVSVDPGTGNDAVRVVLEMRDREPDGSDTTKGFVLRVRVDESGAAVTAIYAAPAL